MDKVPKLTDPTYIKDREAYFIGMALHVGSANNHPLHPGGAVITRDREVLVEGRSILAESKAEIDAVGYALAMASKRGIPVMGGTVYTTRYPFSQSVFQCYLAGIRKIVCMSHEWDKIYKQEFKKTARLCRDLGVSLEVYFPDEGDTFSPGAKELYLIGGTDPKQQIDAFDTDDVLGMDFTKGGTIASDL